MKYSNQTATCFTRAGICTILVLSGLTVTGCAGKSRPVIDPAGVDMVQYEKDLAECEQIARQVEQKAG